MSRILLDTSPLSRICHPRLSLEITEWLLGQLKDGAEIAISEVSDYEVRRERLRLKKKMSILRLDALKRTLGYMPITTEVMLSAAQLWADARMHGKPTADPSALDCDVISAAQAQQIDAVVATENARHLSLFVDARYWKDIT